MKKYIFFLPFLLFSIPIFCQQVTYPPYTKTRLKKDVETSTFSIVNTNQISVSTITTSADQVRISTNVAVSGNVNISGYATISSSISANYLTSSKFFIGEVYVSSTTYPAFYGCWDFTRDTITIVGVRAYAVYSSTVGKTEFDICYSSTSQGTSWYSIFTSTVPWIGANATTSNWFVPNIQTLYPDYSFAPRIISIPASGTLPNIAIEVKYYRRTDK